MRSRVTCQRTLGTPLLHVACTSGLFDWLIDWRKGLLLPAEPVLNSSVKCRGEQNVASGRNTIQDVKMSLSNFRVQNDLTDHDWMCGGAHEFAATALFCLCDLAARVPAYRSEVGLDCRPYQIFWELVGLERVPLSLASTIEELLGRIKQRLGSRKPIIRPWGALRWPRETLYALNLALTSPTSGGRSVSIVRVSPTYRPHSNPHIHYFSASGTHFC
jgi:hypothetical protein